MAKKCSITINRENIELCFNIRKIYIEYRKTVLNLINDEKNKIRKDINSFHKKGKFIPLLDKIIKKYIETNSKITNLEIIELIKNYDPYYTDDRYIMKREPDILRKISLENIDDNFKKNYREMRFERMFRKDLKNYRILRNKPP